jgi:hypothetical protein
MFIRPPPYTCLGIECFLDSLPMFRTRHRKTTHTGPAYIRVRLQIHSLPGTSKREIKNLYENNRRIARACYLRSSAYQVQVYHTRN